MKYDVQKIPNKNHLSISCAGLADLGEAAIIAWPQGSLLEVRGHISDWIRQKIM